MFNLNRISYALLYLMLLSPLLSYVSFGLMHGSSSSYYFQVFICIYALLFIFLIKKSIKLEADHFFLIGYITYLIIWSFFNDSVEDKNFIYQFLNNVTLPHIAILFFLFVIYNTTFTDSFIKTTVIVIKTTVIIASAVSVMQFFNPDFLDAWKLYNEDGTSYLAGNKYLDRRTSIFGYINQNELGLSYLPLLSVLVGYILRNKKGMLLFFLFFAAISVFLSNARYVMISFILILIQIFFYQRQTNSGLLKYSFFIVFSLFSFFIITNFFDYNLTDWFDERLLSEGSLGETSRYKAWENFIIFFPQHYIVGTGVHLTREIEYASYMSGSSQIHVGYLSHLVSYGLLGSFFLFGFWILILKKLYKTARASQFLGSFFAFIIFLWAQATLVNYSIFFYGIIFAFIFDKYYSDKIIANAQNKKMNEINTSITANKQLN